MLGLALAFPIGLMVLNPTLMFERGWEQFVGTGIYLWAIAVLGRELWRLWKDESAFGDAANMLAKPALIPAEDDRVLAARIRQLGGQPAGATVGRLMELNRESSALDQEAASGRFTLTRYILYLLPVIGFIGTVEGISKALMNISKVLPMVKNLDDFMNNLTGVTSALQIAFDSTLLALFLSAALMLVQTLVYRRAEDLLARVDRWVVDRGLAALGVAETPAGDLAVLGPQLARIEEALGGLGERLAPQVSKFSDAVDRLPPAFAGLERGAAAISKVGNDFDHLAQTGDVVRKGVATLARIEAALAAEAGHDEQLEQIRRGIDRQCVATEALSEQWSAAFERSSRSTQEQLAKTLGSLKDALDMLNVSMEQGNALYRGIVKKMFPVFNGSEDRDAA
jgi:biopolymer transport protein ExbB/TolQ